MPELLLIDNGSSRPDSTLTLRDLARALNRRLGERVRPVSLLHSDRIDPAALGGEPADTLEPYLRRALVQGRRTFDLIPLLFGPSRALTHFIPEVVADLRRDYGPVRVRIAPELCPLPPGEPRLVDILSDLIHATAAAHDRRPRRMVLVDHGSPLPQVSAVRTWLAARLRDRLGPAIHLEEAAMERRPDPAYDFNGELLADSLHRLAAVDPAEPVIIVLLFLAPGRHAGQGGDLSSICARTAAQFPGFEVYSTGLIGTHPGLVEILATRRAQVVELAADGCAVPLVSGTPTAGPRTGMD